MDSLTEYDAGRVRAEVIILARESRGLTQSRLARAVGLSQGHLSKIEAGLLPVSEPVLSRLAAALCYPAQFFSLPEPLYGAGTSEFFHRKRQAMSSRALGRIHAELNIRRIHIARLLQAVEIDPDRIPELDPDNFGGSAEEVARAVRASWHVPRGPIGNVTDLIESAGGLVVPTEFGTPLLDAVGRYVPGLPPLFFTNRDAPTDRTRLTLAHELGHMVMHRVPNPEMEAQAYQFAAELLMPAHDIAHELTDLYLDRLVGLKLRWRVSMQALLKRADDLGAIEPRRARYLWMLMGKAGFRNREPAEADLSPEPARLLPQIIEVHIRDLGYDERELAELLVLEPAEMHDVYGDSFPPASPMRPKLRVLHAAS